MNAKRYIVNNFDFPEVVVNSDFVELHRSIPPDYHQNMSTEEHIRYTHSEFADLFYQNENLKQVIEHLREMQLIGQSPRTSKTLFGKLLATQLAITVEHGKNLVTEKNGYKATYLYACHQKQNVEADKSVLCLNTIPLKAIFPDRDCFIEWFSKQNNESFELAQSKISIVQQLVSPNNEDDYLETLDPLNLGLIEQHVKSFFGAFKEHHLLVLKEFSAAIADILGVLSASYKISSKGSKASVYNFLIEITDSLKEDKIQQAKLFNLRPSSLFKKDNIKITVVHLSQIDKTWMHFYQTKFEILYQHARVLENGIQINTITNDQVIIKQFNFAKQLQIQRFTQQEYFDRHNADDVTLYLQACRLIKV